MAQDVARSTARTMRIDWYAVAFLIAVHIVAVVAFVLPIRLAYILAALTIYVLAGVGTTVGLHRLLSHRSFQCPKWVEYALVSSAMLTGQGSPLQWVANHRIHHRFSDHDGDVHSPRRGFWYGYVGWICDDDSVNVHAYRKYCRDLANDRYYHWLVRYRFVPQGAAILLVALCAGWKAVPFVFYLPVVCWMNTTYAVNAVCHFARFGSRRFHTPDDSRNVWWLGVLAFGDGWHNNHHADRRSARHGFAWYEIDLGYGLIRLLARLGLAWEVVEPKVMLPAGRTERDAVHWREQPLS